VFLIICKEHFPEVWIFFPEYPVYKEKEKANADNFIQCQKYGADSTPFTYVHINLQNTTAEIYGNILNLVNIIKGIRLKL
jgi:hypothetical protein